MAKRIVKVRRVGNSNVVSIPVEFESRGFAPGARVLVEGLPGGELRLLLLDGPRERVGRVGRRIVAERSEGIRVLVEYDESAAPDSRVGEDDA